MKECPKIMWDTVSCIGDSITAGYYDEEGLGWVSRLSAKVAKECTKKYMFYNFGIANDTVLDALHGFHYKLENVFTSVLLIHIGVNDTCINLTGEGRQTRLSIGESFSKWSWIAWEAKKRKYKTLIISPLPVQEDEIFIEPYPDNPKDCKGIIYSNKEILAYVNRLDDFCREQDLPFLRVYEDWLGKDCYADGLHPNAEGHQILAQQIYTRLKELEFLK